MKFDKQSAFILCVLFVLLMLPGVACGNTFIWGTEGNGFLISDLSDMPIEKKEIMNQVNQVLGVKYIKVRVGLPESGEFKPSVCSRRGVFYVGDDSECGNPDVFRYDLDQTAELFSKNGWSMFPMFSHAGGPRYHIPIDSKHIERFVDFVDWFVGRYRGKANIRYIELINAPYHTWRGTAKQLFDLNNKTYERINKKYPDVKVGTPGFEYYRDTTGKVGGKDIHRFRDYFLNNDAKFDFWAFHGYPTLGDVCGSDIYPPTKTAIHDRLSGIRGIVELRKRMDKRGWQDRDIIDAEHTGILIHGRRFNEAEDKANAAFIVQELVLKRSLALEGKKVLAGILALKMLPRCERGQRDRKGREPPPKRRLDQEARIQSQDRRQRPSHQIGRPPQRSQGVRSKIKRRDSISSRPPEKSIFGGECAWGSLNPDGSLTETVRAMGLLIAKLKGLDHTAHISGNFDDVGTLWIEKFSGPDRDLYICFKPFTYRQGQPPELEATTLPYTIKLTNCPNKIEIKDIFGSEIKASLDKTIPVHVSNAPQFIDIEY